jgi:hypothetical protein
MLTDGEERNDNLCSRWIFRFEDTVETTVDKAVRQRLNVEIWYESYTRVKRRVWQPMLNRMQEIIG